jgi:trans-aconitate methyltransferase
MDRIQTWNAERYAEHAHFVPQLGQPVLDLLQVQPGERILDLGCGDGVLSEKMVALGASLLGVDDSEDMVEAAKRRGVDARLMSAYELNFRREFDAVFSNAALHWMKQDPDAVIRGVARALRPKGRFVGEMGGHGNVAAITVALLSLLERHGVEKPTNPWYFPSAEEYRERLEQHGFSVEYIELIPRPTRLPTGMAGWIETFGMPMMRCLPESHREAALQETVSLLRPVLCDRDGTWTADYVRLRFVARV